MLVSSLPRRRTWCDSQVWEGKDNSKGGVEASYELAAGGDIRSESGIMERESGMTEVACALNIPAGQWHTLRALESGTVILEMKDGA